MSAVQLDEVKRWCRVIHAGDDQLLEELIDQAEDEALRYLNRTQPPTLPADLPPLLDSDGNELPEDSPSSDDPVAPSFRKAVCMLVQAYYEAPDPDKQRAMRENALNVLAPYRTGLGV